VDLDHFSEEEEQEIFEHAVDQVVQNIAHILPDPYSDLVSGPAAAATRPARRFSQGSSLYRESSMYGVLYGRAGRLI
jgi:hypothetical protein